MKKTINYILSIGYRCTSKEILNKFKLSKTTNPLEWISVDFETSLINLNTNFENYFDLIKYNKNENIFEVFNKTLQIFESNNDIFDKNENIIKLKNELNKFDNFFHMKNNFNDRTIFINYNYVDKIYNNTLKWNKIMIFIHYDFTNEQIRKNLLKRIKRNIEIDKYNETLYFSTRVACVTPSLKYKFSISL